MRIIVAGLLGAVVLFVWGFVYWAVLSEVLLPYKHMADESAVIEVLGENLAETGVYWFPMMPKLDAEATDTEKEEATAAMNEKYRQGPRGQVVYLESGADPMGTGMFVKGFVIDFFSALLASILLCCACGRSGYAGRVAFVFGLGLFTAVSVHLIAWNFMLNPMGITLFKIGDSVVSWLLTGMVIAAVVKPRAEAVA